MELNLSALKKMNIGNNYPLVSLLQKLPLFESVDICLIDSLVSECPMESYESWVTILSEWDISNGRAYVILSGSVDVYIWWEKISNLSEWALFWEYALICSENRSATIISTSSLQCIILDETHILQLSDETNKLNDLLTERITQNLEKSG